jgi:predicted transcriptional regulator
MDTSWLLLVVGAAVFLGTGVVLIVWLPMHIRHALSGQQLTVSKNYEVHVDALKVLEEMDVSEVEKKAREQLLKVAETSAKRLQESLDNTVDQIASNINDLTSTQISQEFEKYQVSLQALRDQSIAEFNKMQDELAKRKTDLMEHLEREVVKELEKRVDRFTGRLNDVVASYITETLGNEVDLGAQSTYIFAALEAHKDDIKRSF